MARKTGEHSIPESTTELTSRVVPGAGPTPGATHDGAPEPRARRNAGRESRATRDAEPKPRARRGQESDPEPLPHGVSPYLRELLADRAEHVHVMRDLLVQAYGYTPFKERSDPVGGLVGTILSQHTSDTNSHRAYASLRERFPTWQQVADAPVLEVEDAIRSGGLAAMKAPRIQRTLREIDARFGAYDLSVLDGMSRDEARTLLLSLGHGIGPKTASCVLMFSLGVPAFCVDTHIQRVCARLGLIRPNDAAEKAQTLLEATVEPEDVHALHIDMIRHGRQVCRAQRPLCGQCPLREICLFGSS